jgi:hypothetical protein
LGGFLHCGKSIYDCVSCDSVGVSIKINIGTEKESINYPNGTWKIKKIGKLTIDEEHIHLIVNGEAKTYDFPSLNQLKR